MRKLIDVLRPENRRTDPVLLAKMALGAVFAGVVIVGCGDPPAPRPMTGGDSLRSQVRKADESATCHIQETLSPIADWWVSQ